MIQDFKFAFRQLIKTPGFTAIAVLTLAIAIGVNSAVFALVNGVILRPVVPLRPAEVVNVFTARQGAAHDYRPFSYNEFSALRENNDVFADVGAMAFALGRNRTRRRDAAQLRFSHLVEFLFPDGRETGRWDGFTTRPSADLTPTSRSWWRAIHIGKNSAAEPI